RPSTLYLSSSTATTTSAFSTLSLHDALPISVPALFLMLVACFFKTSCISADFIRSATPLRFNSNLTLLITFHHHFLVPVKGDKMFNAFGDKTKRAPTLIKK